MRLMSETLEQALRRKGFEPSDESFEPHLTVGRVRTPGDWTGRLLDAPSPEARFQIDTLALVQSALGPGGARYEVLATAELK
jgi:2'-5' RNA ligase